ncbi:hypothetical protein DFP94_101905 [Fontibacillus phaseoli]|uniref:Uncharacterized protein n=1 Tax=Fontibacillus phaseoli TaxID=1416533 RepID=A0A369BRK9_9BACL|nr:hypothetical protein [Fontibacillus phaseoli]RCX23308.1 hypothetical protein DFP94_101905 [Fontibacillus phaseoli]
MKLRVGPIVASVAVSALLLFGGWFAYKQWAVESPFEHKVNQMEGVKSVQTDITQKQAIVKLDLEPGTDFGSLVRQIETDGSKWIGSRELKLVVEDHASQELNEMWKEALFPIAQAMENKEYTGITDTLDKLSQNDSGLSAKAEMDERNVYITLTDGKASKFVILPRVPQSMGVWPNA